MDNFEQQQVDNMYILTSVDNYGKFADSLVRQGLKVDYLQSGVEYGELEKLFNEFAQDGVTTTFMPLKLMKQIQQEAHKNDAYIFEPLKGNKKIGVLIPRKVEEKVKKLDINRTTPFLGGRPDRDTIIGDDDIMNLKIACNTVQTFEEFYELV